MENIMENLLYIVKSLWLLMILQGYVYVARIKLHINFHFVPVVVISTITLAVFFAGILGILEIAVWTLAALGTVFSLYSIFGDYRKYNFVSHMSFSATFVALGFFAFAGLLYGTELIHYDNFTHWATVVKEILITNSFPTAESVMIEFSNYPLGTASWIYFVCTLVGNAQGIMLVAQAMLIFACFVAMFAIIHERRRTMLHLILGLGLSTLSFFNVAIRINNLLVDFLLPVLTLAILAVIYTYRKHITKALMVSIPMIGLLVIIKSSGVIFATFAIGYLLYTAIKYRGDNMGIFIVSNFVHQTTFKGMAKLLAEMFVCVLLAFSPLFAWNYHVSRVFAGVENKFETTGLDLSAFGGKTPEEVELVVSNFMSAFTDFSMRSIVGLWIYEIVAIVAIIVSLVVLKKKWDLIGIFIDCNVAMLAYFGSLLAMYIFSMPMEEAVYLAGFDRYASSMVILLGGVITMCLTVDIENSFHYRLGEIDDYRAFRSVETKNTYNMTCVVMAMFLFMILTSELNGTAFSNQQFENSIPAKVQAVVGDNWEEVDESRYLLYAPDTDGQVTSYYLHYVTRYYLWANNVDGICRFYEDNMLNLLSQYDYLVIVEPDIYERILLNRYFGLKGDAGIYETKELLKDYPEYLDN